MTTASDTIAPACETTVSPRKEAKQRRSRVKVEKILDTALTMLSEGSADKITTNAIAKRAGISIGSLYQFFPNKEAIFYELFQRWLVQTLDALDAATLRMEAGDPKEKCVDAILDALSGSAEINSPGHWQLRRAMGSSPELADLEHAHLRQIVERIKAMQTKLGCFPPAELADDLALLQNQTAIACLQVLAQTVTSGNQEQVRGWCRKLLLLAFDYQELS